MVDLNISDDDIKSGVECAAQEMKRQFDAEDGSLSWYTEFRETDGSIKFIAVDGNPDLEKLVTAVLNKFKESKQRLT